MIDNAYLKDEHRMLKDTTRKFVEDEVVPNVEQWEADEEVPRELVNRIQRLRKDSGLEITDRIRLAVSGSDAVREAAGTHETLITGETLAAELTVDGAPEDYDATQAVDLDGEPAVVALSKV